jgi:predicted NBD/HSP70 family sugar kinase
MYLGIDIGGTKTLCAALDANGVIIEEIKFPTNPDYKEFLKELESTIEGMEHKDFAAGAVAVPATKLDREHGIVIACGNLPWRNESVQKDIEALVHVPIAIENDAKLAALSEAMLLKDDYSLVLYVTVSTGIGYGLINHGKIDDNIGDGGGRTIMLEYEGKTMPWEDFASGKAIVQKYGKRAVDISDAETWEAISRELSKGLIELIAIADPEVIVFGGGVGHYFDRFKKPLEANLEKYHIPIIDLPKLVTAQRPDEAVVYGCYDLVKQVFPNA